MTECLENRIDLQVIGIGDWLGVCLSLPVEAMDLMAEGIAKAAAMAERLNAAETVMLADRLRSCIARQQEELAAIAADIPAAPASPYRHYAPFPDPDIEKALDALAASCGMPPERVEVEAIRRGIAAMMAEL